MDREQVEQEPKEDPRIEKMKHFIEKLKKQEIDKKAQDKALSKKKDKM